MSNDRTTSIVGYMVCTQNENVASAALYNLSEHDKALDAARRWNASITALVRHPARPDAGPASGVPMKQKELLSLAMRLEEGAYDEGRGVVEEAVDTLRFVADHLFASRARAVADEREACARIVESANNHDNPMTANDCAAAIRARGTP